MKNQVYVEEVRVSKDSGCFFLVWAKRLQQRKCCGDIVSLKMLEYNIKGLCTLYMQHNI